MYESGVSVPDVSPRAFLLFWTNPKWNVTSLSDSSPQDRSAAMSYILWWHTLSKIILYPDIIIWCEILIVKCRPTRVVIYSFKFARAWKAEIVFVKWSRQCKVCLWSVVLRGVSKVHSCCLLSGDVYLSLRMCVRDNPSAFFYGTFRHFSGHPMGNVGEWSIQLKFVIYLRPTCV